MWSLADGCEEGSWLSQNLESLVEPLHVDCTIAWGEGMYHFYAVRNFLLYVIRLQSIDYQGPVLWELALLRESKEACRNFLLVYTFPFPERSLYCCGTYMPLFKHYQGTDIFLKFFRRCNLSQLQMEKYKENIYACRMYLTGTDSIIPIRSLFAIHCLQKQF